MERRAGILVVDDEARNRALLAIGTAVASSAGLKKGASAPAFRATSRISDESVVTTTVVMPEH